MIFIQSDFGNEISRGEKQVIAAIIQLQKAMHKRARITLDDIGINCNYHRNSVCRHVKTLRGKNLVKVISRNNQGTIYELHSCLTSSEGLDSY